MEHQRLVAKPEEPARSKLSVIANALFHISPLPPLHHVVNVDKRSSRTESRFTKVGRGIYREDKDLNQQRIGEQEREPRTITYPRDFWPIRTGLVNAGRAYPRPPFLGILLEPRVSSVIRQEQKDSWEYVLRRCFVREAVPFRDAVKTLGFGGENLIPKFELFDDQFLGERVNVDKLVRDLRAEEWARVVDVFDRWAFRPQVSQLWRSKLTADINCGFTPRRGSWTTFWSLIVIPCMHRSLTILQPLTDPGTAHLHFLQIRFIRLPCQIHLIP